MGLTSVGVSLVAEVLIKGDSGTGYKVLNSTNARIGVGDGTTAFSAAHTDLQGANKLRKGMEAGYPTRAGGTATFRASFGSSEANFAWEEWGVFDAATGGNMVNRKVQSLGTKSSGETWVLTAQLNFNAST